ncbi:quinone oxidoreductase family protein [Mycolicibacterium bacteremicum]|uniref:Oxidoreductase n=1 Tax=Mycolicibacterium bacteremicum TaxID=564198 RepID=A0A1W9YWQ7_MYCBA|nr:NADP-dependent oxidoreductase [Mycolicibacterium bacteremicum]MCV7431587.1 NADP-dependent oxidoreductase [Mycolicibacterium bacteremicum]ORA04417.1 oxidoreductase [Mycolicibacterium bacteremicum]
MTQTTAVLIPQFGTPDVLQAGSVDVRPPRAGEVRIAVQAAAVNPTDIATRSGLVAAAYADFTPPYIAGMDAAGTVESIGDGVTRLSPGDPVMAIVMPRRPEGGAHSALIVVPEAAVAPIPDGLSVEQAAMLPMNGLTALEALSCLDLAPGSTLGITGGAGYLSAFVTVLAKRAGITVIADGRPDDRDTLLRRGVDVVVERGSGLAQRFYAATGSGLDAVLDTALLGADLFDAIRDNGRFATVRTFDDVAPRGISVRPVWVRERLLDTAGLLELSALATEGAFDFLDVTGRYGPDRAADAHRAVEAGGLRGRPLIVF